MFLAVRDSPPFWFWLTLIIAGALFSWWAFVQQRHAAANLRELAQRLGLEFFDDKRSVGDSLVSAMGQHEGRAVTFHTFTTGSGKSRKTWRAVSVRPRTIGSLLFHLRPQGFVTKLQEVFGAEEITVGDAAFDAAWFIETNEPDFLRAALVPEVRAKLMAAHADAGSDGNFQLETAAVRYAEHGTFADPNDCLRFEQLLPLLHELADIAEVSAKSAKGG
jgi:hypothetical protein